MNTWVCLSNPLAQEEKPEEGSNYKQLSEYLSEVKTFKMKKFQFHG